MSNELITEASGVRKVIRKIRTAQELGFDVEFDSPDLPPTDSVLVHQSVLVGINLAFEDGTAYYLPVRHAESPGKDVVNCPPGLIGDTLDALQEADAIVWAHNAVTELTVVRQHGRDLTNLACSQVLAWMMDVRGHSGGLGLKSLEKKMLGMYRPGYMEVTNGRKFSMLHPKDALDYAAQDARSTLQIGQILMGKAREWGVSNVFWKQEMPFMRVICRMQENGIPLDRDRMLELDREFSDKMGSLEEEWDFLVPGVLIGSSQKVSDYFFPTSNAKAMGSDPDLEVDDRWPSIVTSAGKSGRMSVDKKCMSAIVLRDDVEPVYREAARVRLAHSSYKTCRNTYTRTLVDHANRYMDRRVRSNINQTVARTGRTSSSDPNLQNIPIRTPEGRRIKEAFVASDGMLLVSLDFSQIELRVLAHIAGGGFLYDQFVEGADVHQAMADALGVDRFQAKTWNFALIYGAGTKRLVSATGASVEAVKKNRAMLNRVMSRERKVLEDIADKAQRDGFVRIPSGRVRFIPEFRAHDGVECTGWGCEACYLKSKGRRIAVNTPIQGFATDVFKRACNDLVARDSEWPDGTKEVAQIHDEITFEVPEDYAHEFGEWAAHVMESSVELSVPLKVDVGVGKNWYEAKG